MLLNNILGALSWFSVACSLITMSMLWLKNNSVYNDLIVREMSNLSKVSEEVSKDGTFATVAAFFQNLVWKIRLHGRFTFAPIIKTSPSLLFRVFAYSLILLYSSDLYRGIGLLMPFGILSIMTILNFSVGKLMLPTKDEELLVNSVSGIVLPVYIDVFDIVSSD